MEKREILKKSAIDPARIDSRQFTKSLLNEMFRIGSADRAFLEFFQTQLFSILQYQLNEVTNGESSSVPAELADELMEGIGYCIDQAIKSVPTLEESAQMLKNQSVTILYEQGKMHLSQLAKSCVALLSRVQATRLDTENSAYQSLLDSTFPSLLHNWKTCSFYHDFEIVTEYPLAVEANVSGIPGIHMRLTALALENRFCAKFSAKSVQSLLAGYAHQHRVSPADAYVNLFTIILQNYLLNRLIGKDGLELTVDDRQQLEHLLLSLEPNERAEQISQCANQILQHLNFDYPKLEDYVRTASNSFANQLNAAKGNLIELCVVTPAEHALIHTDGERLDNDAFKLIADEVMLAETPQEKVDLLRRELRSLADLADLLASGSIFEDEFEPLFALMSPITLALLLSVSPAVLSKNSISIQSSEEWQTALVKYLNGLDSEQKDNIIALYRSAVG